MNRILRSGYTPTVLMWADSSVYREDGEAMDASGCLLVCDRSVAKRQYHVGLPLHAGDAGVKRWEQLNPRELVLNGNTGVCAARWALSLGCQPVYLLGMAAEYDGRTDFYGDNRWHHRAEEGATCSTLSVMRGELHKFCGAFGDLVRPVDSPELLRWAVEHSEAVDEAAIREGLREFFAAAS